jgi:hypothetical protein
MHHRAAMSDAKEPDGYANIILYYHKNDDDYDDVAQTLVP